MQVSTEQIRLDDEARAYCPSMKDYGELIACRYTAKECVKADECAKKYRHPMTKEEHASEITWHEIKGKTPPAIESIIAEIIEPAPYENFEELYGEIVAYLKKHLVLGYDSEYYVVTSWVVASWLVWCFNEAPFLAIFGPMGHGKTRTLEVLWHLAYRAIPASRVTKSALPRLMDGVDATLLLDEAEFYVKRLFGTDEGLWAVLNSMHRRGQASIVCEEKTTIDEKGNKVREQVPVARKCFGFVAMASRKDLFDATQDRCIEIVLPKNRPVNRRIDADTAKAIRSKLAQLAVNVKEQKETLATPPEELRKAQPPRLEDIFESIYRATPVKFHDKITEKLRMEGEAREERLRDSLEYEILSATRKMMFDADGQEIKLEQNPLLKMGAEGQPIIANSTLMDIINQDRPENRKLSTRTVGRALHKLGLAPIRARLEGKVVRGYVYRTEVYRALFESYGLLEGVTTCDHTVTDPPPSNQENAPHTLMSHDVTVPPPGSIPHFEPKLEEVKPKGDRET